MGQSIHFDPAQPTRCILTRKGVVAERVVGDDGNTVCIAPWRYFALEPLLPQMAKDLVTSSLTGLSYGQACLRSTISKLLPPTCTRRGASA